MKLPLDLDLSNVQVRADFQPLPSGPYNVKITNTAVKETRTGGLYVSFEFTIIDGNSINRKIFDNINIKNMSEKAQAIGLEKLKTLAVVTGIDPANLHDTEVFHGKTITLKISVDPTAKQNIVKGYSAFDKPSKEIPF